MIFAVTREGKGFLATTILFSLVLKHRKSVHFRNVSTILHTCLQLMWIESVLGHSFLACNILWPCSLVETSDTEWEPLIAKDFKFEVPS